jgi:hypothetical protein
LKPNSWRKQVPEFIENLWPAKAYEIEPGIAKPIQNDQRNELGSAICAPGLYRLKIHAHKHSGSLAGQSEANATCLRICRPSRRNRPPDVTAMSEAEARHLAKPGAGRRSSALPRQPTPTTLVTLNDRSTILLNDATSFDNPFLS